MEHNGPFAGRKVDDYFWGMLPETDEMQPREISPPHLRDIGPSRIIEMPAPRIIPGPQMREMPDPRLRQMPDPRRREMPPVPVRDERDPQMMQALDVIRDAVRKEAQKAAFYDYLIKQAPTMDEKRMIQGIRDSELKHMAMLKRLYEELTGETPSTAHSEMGLRRPSSYCDGIKRGLLDQQEAADKHKAILTALRDRRHINMVTGMITDELRHLGLFNYLYARNKCNN